MANAWITHVRKYATENNISYGCALSTPECKEEYRKKTAQPNYSKQLQKLGDLVRSKQRGEATVGFNDLMPKIKALEDGVDRDRQMMLLSTLRKAIGKLQSVSS